MATTPARHVRRGSLRIAGEASASGLASGRVLTANSGDVIAQIEGELWRAKAAEPLTPAGLVDVLALEGLALRVRPRLHALAHR